MATIMAEKLKTPKKRKKPLAEEMKSVSRVLVQGARYSDLTPRQFLRAIARLLTMPERAQERVIETVSKEGSRKAVEVWVMDHLPEDRRRRIANKLKLTLDATVLTHGPYSGPY